jgi:hypothetical protein
MIQGRIAIVPITMHYDHVLPEYKSMYKSYDDNVGVPIIDKESMEIFFRRHRCRPQGRQYLRRAQQGEPQEFPADVYRDMWGGSVAGWWDRDGGLFEEGGRAG